VNSTVTDLPEELRLALARDAAGVPTERLRAAVGRLVTAYRSGTPPESPVLAGDVEAAAYAAYRMPATFAAVRAALSTVPGGFAPASLTDVGGGTGAAAWAAAAAYPTLGQVTVLDQSGPALRRGVLLAAGAAHHALRQARWRQAGLVPAPDLPAADLVTVSYVLGELPDAARWPLVEAAAGAGGVLVIVEPGTPAGYARVIEARERLLALGQRVLAPCPHPLACPLAVGDWCHFGARVNRSALHRRLKDADLGYEDEKFSYLATVAPGVGPEPAAAGSGRVLRRPVQRKGLVALRLCRPDGTAGERLVSRRDAALYRLARDASWGGAFPAGPQ